MTHSLIPLLFFIVLVTLISALVFDTTLRELSDPTFTTYNWFFLIFTNDNFDRILPDEISLNITYLLFFFPCIYIGQQFLLSLIIGDTYEIYKIYVKKQLKKEKLKEIQGLTKAFSSLDIDKTGIISYLQFKECCIKLNPNLSNESIALYFELISNGNSVITILQFLKIRNILNFHLIEKTNKKAIFSSIYLPIYDKISILYKNIQIPIYSSSIKLSNSLLNFMKNYNIISIINSIDIILLCCSQLDYIITTINIYYNNNTYITINITISIIINIIYIMEFFLYLFNNNGKIYLVHKNNNITTNLFILGVIGRIIIDIIQNIYTLSRQTLLKLPIFPFTTIYNIYIILPIYKIILLLQGFRCIRIININKDLKQFSIALIDVIPALIETFTFSFIVTYIFGCIGHILFGSYISEWGSPLAAIVKTQKLTYMLDFLFTTEKTMRLIHPITCFYFIFYLILTLTVSNIALSIIIELQNNILSNKTTKEYDNQKNKLELMFNKIKDQARLRAIFTNTGNLNFSNIIMSKFQSSDTRHFIADINDEKDYFNIDDIKACQKYSTIDLISRYYMENRNNTEQHWEVEFLTSVTDYGIKDRRVYSPGEVVYIAGECAKELFLVLRGSFILSEPHCMGAAFASASYFIGHETLTPNTKYQWQCAAETEAEVIVFTQNDITDNLNSDLCGTILRMTLKSYKKLETSLLESRKRSSRGLSHASYSENIEVSCQEKAKSLNSEVLVLPSKSGRERGLVRESSFELTNPILGLVRRGSHVVGLAPVLTKTAAVVVPCSVVEDSDAVDPTVSSDVSSTAVDLSPTPDAPDAPLTPGGAKVSIAPFQQLHE